MKKNKDLGILGLWHLGSVYSACLAKLGFRLEAWDFDEKVIDNYNKGIPSIEEPGLREAVGEALNKNLFFTNKPEQAIANKKYVFVTFDVPVDEKDRTNLEIVDKAFDLIVKFISRYTTIVVSSQIPVGYCRKKLEKIRKKDETVNLIYFPENLRLGTAFDSFLKADRVIIGSDNPKILDEFERDFKMLGCSFIKMGLESAEMVKHALNSYIAMMISYSSEIGDLCELVGADMNEVVGALKTEKRISKYAPINPGLGFAGGTLGRDIQTLRKLSKDYKYKLRLMDAVYKVNQKRIAHLVEIIKTFLPDLRSKKVGILGLTYKPNTNTLRRSMALELASVLEKEGAELRALDPMIRENINNFEFIKISQGEDDFFDGLDMAVLMTDCQEFRLINWKKASRKMKSKYFVDAKNFIDKKILGDCGFEYRGIGYRG